MKKKSLNETFGSYIRSLRIKNEIGQRELAKKIGLAASYLNDIEKNKRSAPKNDIIKKLSLILKVDLDLLNDLAGISKNTLPPDILDYIEKNPEIISLLRSAKNNNILNSIFYGEEVINGNIIISYSDILFEPFVVKRAIESDHDISVIVDIDWRDYYIDRKDHPLSEAENVIFNSNNEVVKIGKIASDKEEVHGEFIGMIKLNHRGCEIFKQNFHRVKKHFWNKPFQRAKIFQKAYLTDMIQELVDIGIKVHCVIIERGWKEIDTVEDYRKALIDFKR